jgi:DNA-binding NarL/FixJ family response regulator
MVRPTASALNLREARTEAVLALADADDEHALRRSFEELQPSARSLRRQSSRAACASVGARRRGRAVLARQHWENPAHWTMRELEVVGHLAEGLRNADIAERLSLSEKTVDHHVSAILRKLDVRTRREAGAESVRLGLVG